MLLCIITCSPPIRLGRIPHWVSITEVKSLLVSVHLSFFLVSIDSCVLIGAAMIVYGEYVSQHSTDVIQKTSLFMMDSWIAFTNNLDPNRPNRKLYVMRTV